MKLDPWEILVTEIYDGREFCVYGHYCDEKLFYVGCGQLDRAFQFGPQRRNEAWHRFRAGRRVTVRIFLRLNTKAEARRQETRIIAQLRPIANETETQRQRIEMAERAGARQPLEFGMREVIVCYPSGDEYDSIADAVAATGISQGAISNSIMGRYPIVRGVRFARTPTNRPLGVPQPPMPPLKECDRCGRPVPRNSGCTTCDAT